MSDAFRGSEFGVTNAVLAAGGRVRGLKVAGGAALSRKQLDEIEADEPNLGALISGLPHEARQYAMKRVPHMDKTHWQIK